jgi:hypothetical protein
MGIQCSGNLQVASGVHGWECVTAFTGELEERTLSEVMEHEKVSHPVRSHRQKTLGPPGIRIRV